MSAALLNKTILKFRNILHTDRFHKYYSPIIYIYYQTHSGQGITPILCGVFTDNRGKKKLSWSRFAALLRQKLLPTTFEMSDKDLGEKCRQRIRLYTAKYNYLANGAVTLCCVA